MEYKEPLLNFHYTSVTAKISGLGKLKLEDLDPYWHVDPMPRLDYLANQRNNF